MKYDVFISYSRKDTQHLHLILSRLKRDIPSLKIWYDVDGVESASDFQSKIIDAIDDSNIVIFVCSDHSLDSEYCRKEIMYAKNTEKTVIPYLLPGMKLKKWLLFEFGNINCISSTKEDEVNRMIRDLKKWVEKDKVSQTHESANTNNNVQQAELYPRIGDTKPQTVANSESEIKTNGNFINGHEYVDLGLPSGLKWATCNVGASKPEEYGDYFAWGEIRTKSSYEERNCQTSRRDKKWLLINGYFGENGDLILSKDAAHQNWGGSWRMPTLNEIKELINHTTAQWTILNGVKGRLLRSKNNGKCIFLPSSGWYNCSSLKGVEEGGYYWSSTHGENETAFGINLNSNYFRTHWDFTSIGRSVRPVTE